MKLNCIRTTKSLTQKHEKQAMKSSNIDVPFSECKHRRVFETATNGDLDIEVIDEIGRLSSAGNTDGEVILVTQKGALQFFERIAMIDPEELSHEMEEGLSPNGPLEFDFSIRIDLEAVEHRAAALDDEKISQWLDLLNRLAHRSARQIRSKQSNDWQGGICPENWMPPIDDMFVPEENEIVSGSWAFFGIKEVKAWHRGLVNWGDALLPLVSRVSKALFNRWDRDQLNKANGTLH